MSYPSTQQLILDINAGKIDAHSANWTELVQTACRSDLLSTPAPFIWWLLVSFSEIKDRDTRIHSLYDICDHLSDYLGEFHLLEQKINYYRNECRSLANFYRTIEREIVPYYGNSVGNWADGRNQEPVDIEVYRYFKHIAQLNTIDEYMAFVQANHDAIIHPTERRFIPHVVAAHAFLHREQMYINDIRTFCTSLLMAETTRLKYLAGWENPFPAVTIDSFDRELRNRCFDYYLEHRLQNIRLELNKENRRLHDASPKECMLRLLEIDTQEYRRLKSIGNLCGSVVYDREWGSGTPDVLAMEELFLQYLSELIDGTSVTNSTPSVEPQQTPSVPAIPSANLNLPLGVIYYLWDPRTPAKNKFIADNAHTIMAQLWENVLAKCPEIKPLGGFKLHIVYQHLPVDALMLNHIAAFEWSRIDYSDYPSFVLRCPHVQQAKLIGSNHKEKPTVGLTKIIYHSNWDCVNLDYYVQVLSGAISHAFRNMIGLTTDYLCSSYPDLSLSLPEKKQKLLADMWEGELILHQLDDRDISEFDSILADYDGIGSDADDFDSTLLPYSNAAYSHKDSEPPIDQTQNNLYKHIRDYAEKQIHQKQDYTITEQRMAFIQLFNAADEAYLGRDVRTAITARSTAASTQSQPAAPADWTAINLWLMDRADVTSDYLDDFSHFSTIMRGYLQQGEKLETILAYLLRYDGKFLNLPRHSKGKSKGRLDQTSIRESMEKAGFPFKKSNYSKILQGL